MTNFWCVLRRGTRLRDRGPVTSSKPLLQENDPLASVAPREDDQNGPRSDAGTQLPHVLTEQFLAVTQQFPRHIFSRVIPRHFVKFDHSGITILVATNWFCDSSKNPNLLFLFDLGFSC